MRLIEVATLRLVEFFDTNIPSYAILSHTWGEEEVTFSHMQQPESCRHMKGFEKILLSAMQAEKHNLRYIWVDTCCIDKSSSAELSEAINSMFRWYTKATVCYAFLQDVKLASTDEAETEVQFLNARWFTRGWTLQELLASTKVMFYDARWQQLGSKSQLASLIERATGISVDDLGNLAKALSRSVAVKMRWASKRETTRTEDRAYSLLGIFQVNIPLLYGEGHKAFQRLQEEIIKQTEDQSLLAWGYDLSLSSFLPEGALAKSPAPFRNCVDALFSSEPRFSYTGNSASLPPSPWQMTSRGLRIDLPVVRCVQKYYDRREVYAWAPICYTFQSCPGKPPKRMIVILPLRPGPDGAVIYRRTARTTPLFVEANHMPLCLENARYTSVFIPVPFKISDHHLISPVFDVELDIGRLSARGYKLTASSPPDRVDVRDGSTIRMTGIQLTMVTLTKLRPEGPTMYNVVTIFGQPQGQSLRADDLDAPGTILLDYATRFTDEYAAMMALEPHLLGNETALIEDEMWHIRQTDAYSFIVAPNDLETDL